MKNFRTAITDVAREALKRGEISKADYRRLNLALLFPSINRRLAKFAFDMAVEEQVITTGTGFTNHDATEIDWGNFFEFLGEILPQIIEFLRGIGVIS